MSGTAWKVGLFPGGSPTNACPGVAEPRELPVAWDSPASAQRPDPGRQLCLTRGQG